MKTLEEAKVLIARGGTLIHEGSGPSLKVWIETPEFVAVNPSDFRPLAEFARELRIELKEVRPEPIPHILTPDSKAIYSYGYDPERQVFEVRYKFTPTTLYTFSNVPPEIFEGARTAESVGSFISKTFPKGQTLYGMAKTDDRTPLGSEGLAQTLQALFAQTLQALKEAS